MKSEEGTLTTLRGRIRGLRKENSTVDAFQGDELRARSSVAGTLAVAAGLSGIAAGMVAISMDEMREAAFGISFEIDGKSVRGVLWDCPFGEEDEVEVVAEKSGEHWNMFAVARPRDRIISLFPHVVAGEIAHYKSSLSLWGKFILVLFILTAAMAGLAGFLVGVDSLSGGVMYFVGGFVIASAVLAVIGFNTARKYMPFVRIAEGVFTALGWQDVKRIDLRKRTLKQIKPGDDAALGVFHFRY